MTYTQIFLAYAQVGALTFGGGYAMMPLLQKIIAGKKNWASPEEIMDAYAVAQCLPGIIAVNTAMILGHRQKKMPGLLAAGLGVLFPSVVVILIIAAFIGRLLEYEIVRHMFNAVQAAVLALVADAVIKMWKSGVKDLFGVIIFAVTLTTFTVFPSLSPVFPLVAGAACGIIIKERKRGGKTS